MTRLTDAELDAEVARFAALGLKSRSNAAPSMSPEENSAHGPLNAAPNETSRDSRVALPEKREPSPLSAISRLLEGRRCNCMGTHRVAYGAVRVDGEIFRVAKCVECGLFRAFAVKGLRE